MQPSRRRTGTVPAESSSRLRQPSLMISNFGPATPAATSTRRDPRRITEAALAGFVWQIRRLDARNPTASQSTWQKPIMTAAEASALLNVSRNTLYNWARLGRVKAYRDGFQWRYLRCEILEIAASVCAAQSGSEVERILPTSSALPRSSTTRA